MPNNYALANPWDSYSRECAKCHDHLSITISDGGANYTLSHYCDKCQRELDQEFDKRNETDLNQLELELDDYRLPKVNCAHCHNEYLEIDLTLRGVNLVCDDCEESYYRCEACSTYTHVDELENVDDTHYCSDCYQESFSNCDDCGNAVSSDDINIINGSVICERCISRYHYCEDCESYNDTRNCPNCYEEFTPDDNPDTWQLFGEGSKYPFHLGLELELTTDEPQKVNSYYRDNFADGFLFGKDDISVRGIEICSNPATLEYFNSLNLSAPANCGLTNAGIHVHISRVFSALTIERVISFFYTNKDDIERLAERANCNYAKFYPLSDYNAYNLDLAKDSVGVKYLAVNLVHSDSIEIRIFKSSLYGETIKRHIQFVAACFLVASMGELTPQTLVSYITDNPDFVNIANYCLNNPFKGGNPTI